MEMAPNTKNGAGSSSNPPCKSLTRDEDGKIKITVYQNDLYPSHDVSKSIRLIFARSMYPGEYTWKDIPHGHKLIWFDELKKEFSWAPALEGAVQKAFMTKGARRFSDFCSRMRNSKDKPDFLNESEWAGWKAYWSSEKFIQKSSQASKNRLAEPDGPGTGIVTHRGGSRSSVEYAMQLAEERGTALEEIPDLDIFNKNHRKDGKYTSRKAARIGDVYETIMEDLTQSEGGSISIADSNAALRQAAGGIVKNRQFGLGNKGKMTKSSSSCTPLIPPEYISREEIRQMMNEEAQRIREEMQQMINQAAQRNREETLKIVSAKLQEHFDSHWSPPSLSNNDDF